MGRRAGRVLVAAAVLLLAACSNEPLPGMTPPGAPGAAPAAAPPAAPACAVQKTPDVPVPMRDGTVLRADVYRPQTPTPVPVILDRTQYDKADSQTSAQRFAPPEWFAAHCYLVVSQDIRGMHASAGRFSEFTHDQDDGYDSVEWAAALPGSTGKVGMYGSSYVGATQWLAAESAPPHLATIIPTNTASDYFNGWTYEDGAFRPGFVEPWAMAELAGASAKQRGDPGTAAQLEHDAKNITGWIPYTPEAQFPPMHPGDAQVAPWYFDWLRHPTDGSYWQQWAPKQRYDRMDIPVLNMEGWYDAFLAGGLENFTGMATQAPSPAARANQRIVIGPYDHVGWGRPNSTEAPLLKAIGPVANSPVNDLMLSWWDHYLKGVPNGVDRPGGPRVDYFQMGSNTWHTTTAWPPPGAAPHPLYLSGGGHANTAGGDGALADAPPGPQAADHYTANPFDPVPSVGGHSCCGVASPVAAQGPYDQRPVEARPDVLSYTTAPMTGPTDVTGPMQVALYAASSAPDTDWTAKVVVVHPDGSAVNLNNGIQRASYRDVGPGAAPGAAPSPITPGQVYRYTINVWPTSYRFAPGDRVRLEVSSSDFPQFDVNPNTGQSPLTSAEKRPAEQTVLHDPAHPSSLVLPVVPPNAEPPTLPAAPTR